LLRIRLARRGKKKQARYRVVVADQRKAVQAKFVEILGWYNPHTKELKINKEKTEGWLSKGANPTNTIARLLKKDGLKLPKWVEIIDKKKKSKSKGEAEDNASKTEKKKEAEKTVESKDSKGENGAENVASKEADTTETETKDADIEKGKEEKSDESEDKKE